MIKKNVYLLAGLMTLLLVATASGENWGGYEDYYPSPHAYSVRVSDDNFCSTGACGGVEYGFDLRDYPGVDNTTCRQIIGDKYPPGTYDLEKTNAPQCCCLPKLRRPDLPVDAIENHIPADSICNRFCGRTRYDNDLKINYVIDDNVFGFNINSDTSYRSECEDPFILESRDCCCVTVGDVGDNPSITDEKRMDDECDEKCSRYSPQTTGGECKLNCGGSELEYNFRTTCDRTCCCEVDLTYKSSNEVCRDFCVNEGFHTNWGYYEHRLTGDVQCPYGVNTVGVDDGIYYEEEECCCITKQIFEDIDPPKNHDERCNNECVGLGSLGGNNITAGFVKSGEDVGCITVLTDYETSNSCCCVGGEIVSEQPPIVNLLKFKDWFKIKLQDVIDFFTNLF